MKPFTKACPPVCLAAALTLAAAARGAGPTTAPAAAAADAAAHAAAHAVLPAALVDAPAAGGSYVDHAYGFAIDGPAFPAAPAGVVVSMSGPAAGGFAPNVNVTVQPKATRDAYKAQTAAGLAAVHGTINGQHDLRVSGRDATEVEFDATLARRHCHFLSLAVFGGDRTYLVTCAARAPDFPAERDRFQKCLDSFRLTP